MLCKGFLPFLLLLGVGCGLPRDPESTTEKVHHATLRVGVTPAGSLVDLSKGQPSGTEVELVKGLAQVCEAHIEWVTGSQDDLFEDLENYHLNALIGGLKKDNPWKKSVKLTRPYDGTHVIALPPGENRWILCVESYLDNDRATLAEMLGGSSR
jgi:polar amino acid transport system substrate-binding protein